MHERLYFVRKLKYFRIDNNLLSLFYRSMIVSIISFCVGAWGGNTVQKDTKKIDSVAKHATRLTGIKQDSFIEIFEKICNKKFNRILNDPTHPFYSQINRGERSGRVLFLRMKTERYRSSFLPTAIKLHSETERR